MEFINSLKQHQLYQQYDAWAEKTSTEILTWAHPGLDLAARPESVRNAPLASFQAMFAFVMLYAVIVFVGMVLYKKPKRAAAGKRVTPSWDEVLQSFKKEPVKIFQAVYNLVQVKTCRTLCVARSY
jgi:Ni,Fe-hydrogenase I cytochrome b subunit